MCCPSFCHITESQWKDDEHAEEWQEPRDDNADHTTQVEHDCFGAIFNAVIFSNQFVYEYLQQKQKKSE